MLVQAVVELLKN